jgi:hypothetical protein
LAPLSSQFKERLRDHRKQVGADITRAARELEYLAHDRSLFLRQTENHRGEPVFDLSAAKVFLPADVAEGKHHQLTPSQLQQSRVEYHPFSAKNFKHRIYQEVRRQKFVNYLNQRRAQGLTYSSTVASISPYFLFFVFVVNNIATQVECG